MIQASRSVKLVKKIILFLLVGLSLSVAIHMLTRTSQTTYYMDICGNIGGCCPGEGHNEGLVPYCPNVKKSVGFPVRTDDYEFTGPLVIFLLNTGIISLACLVVGLPSAALIQKLHKRTKSKS